MDSVSPALQHQMAENTKEKNKTHIHVQNLHKMCLCVLSQPFLHAVLFPLVDADL